MEDTESQKSDNNVPLYQSPIADPMATEKFSSKLYSLVKKCKTLSNNHINIISIQD